MLPASHKFFSLSLILVTSLTLFACGGGGGGAGTSPSNLQNKVVLSSSAPVQYGYFGWSVAISPDGQTLAVSERGRNVAGISGVGAVQIFSKSGSSWVREQLLEPKMPVQYSDFGWDISFSPDGKTLAVSAPGNPLIQFEGFVQLFIDSGTAWTPGPKLVSNTRLGNEFGQAIKFSPDSMKLAIYEHYPVNQIENVQVFKRVANSWNAKPELEQVLISKNPVAFSSFGHSFDFSMDSKTLAVGEQADTQRVVQLFNLSNNIWNYGLVISNNSLLFGISLAFSPDDSSLAIGDTSATVATVTDAGSIQFYKKSGADWTAAPVAGLTIKSNTPKSSRTFGFVFKFNLDGSKIAVTESDDNPFAAIDNPVVHTFSTVNSNFVNDKIITLPSSAYDPSMAFSLDGQLAIGDSSDTVKTIPDAGTVTFY